MSCEQKRGITLFLFVAAVYLNRFPLCSPVTVGQWRDYFTTHRVLDSGPTGWKGTGRDKDVKPEHRLSSEQVNWGLNVRKSNLLGHYDHRTKSTASPGKHLPYSSVTKLATGTTFAPRSWFWTYGSVSSKSKSLAPDSEDGYQADFTGFPGVQGKVLGLSSDSGPHFSEWQAMRPLVECDDNVMTFTASGQGLTHLLVDRDEASPISVLQLPPYCGYSVRTSWSDLEMMVPYDACYITQENGSYVLPMLWLGSPLKLSCPMQTSTAVLSALSVFCSPFGMAVPIHGKEQDVTGLGVTVKGAWGPFVSEQCAYRVNSQSQKPTFFIPFSAPCIKRGDGLHLQLMLDVQEYILSCPISPQLPYVPSPPWSPQQFPDIPDPANPAPTAPPPPPPPPQPPTQKQIVQFPVHPHHPYTGLHFSQLPTVYPQGSQPPHRLKPTTGRPPGPQRQQQLLYPIGPGKFIGPYHYPSGLHYPYGPLYYPAVTPAPNPASPTATTTTAPPPKPPARPYYAPYYHQIPFYPVPTAAPVTQAPPPFPPTPQSPLLPPSPPKQPVRPHYRVSPLYPPVPYSSHYPYWTVSYPSHPTAAPQPSPTTTTTTDSPSYPSREIYFQRPVYFNIPTLLPPAYKDPQKQVAPHDTYLPYTVCSHYSYPNPYYRTVYPPHYHPPYAPVPQYPGIPPPVTSKMPPAPTTTPSGPPLPSPQTPRLQCLPQRMVVFLPSARPNSIQVKDQIEAWLFLSSVSPLCGYMLQMAEGSGVILRTPLPACHSQLRTPTAISLPLRFWDLSTAQYRTVDLQCPYQSTPETPTPVTPLPTAASPTKISPTVVLQTNVLCTPHQMTVELPPGPISEIVVKDIKGNQMNLQEAPKRCGYSASKGKDGKIHLTLRLHSRCYTSVLGKMYIITVSYVTINERKEAQFSCPVVIPGSGQECNLPNEQRLPCRSGSVSRPQCLSMGCCFNKHPPACYYPMDECTIDRHFVFSVPASLTDPPLYPALLVTASNSTCKPQRVTSDYALFKIPMDSCGTRRVVVGKTVVYMVEIINKVQIISLNYGTITRDSPVRLLVECRFVPGTVLSVSYVVKTPTIGPQVQTQGLFGVQLRVAKDAEYKSYYPQYHQPLQMLLGKPLYLEVRLLNSPDPSLVLLVHFCVAYPRSGKAVWVLLYNGCPNPLDPATPQAVLSVPQPHSPQIRRFTISTFQFLPDGEFKDPNEEIYFMCSTEICSPRDGPCVEGCFGQ